MSGNMTFDILFSTVFVKQIGILRFLQLRLQENPALSFDMYLFINT